MYLFYGEDEFGYIYLFIQFDDSDKQLWSSDREQSKFFVEDYYDVEDNGFYITDINSDDEYVKFLERLYNTQRNELVDEAINYCEKVLGGMCG